MWRVRSLAGFYLDERAAWTRDRDAARGYESHAAAYRAARWARKRHGVHAIIEGPVKPRKEQPLSPAQVFALELARQHGGLQRAGERWSAPGASEPSVAANTVHSLVRRGSLHLAEEGRDRHGRRRWLAVVVAPSTDSAGAAA